MKYKIKKHPTKNIWYVEDQITGKKTKKYKTKEEAISAKQYLIGKGAVQKPEALEKKINRLLDPNKGAKYPEALRKADSTAVWKAGGGERFKPSDIKKKELKKKVQDEVKKIRDKIKTLESEVEAYNKLSQKQKDTLGKINPADLIKVKASEQQLTRLTTRLKKIEEKYPEYSKDPLRLFE